MFWLIKMSILLGEAYKFHLTGYDSSDIKTTGTKVDNIKVDIKLTDAKYVYLIIEDKIFDLKRMEDGFYEVNCEHRDILWDSDKVKIIIQQEDGTYLYMNSNIQNYVIYSSNLSLSDGTSCNDTIIEFTTDIEDNQFNAVAMQVYNVETGEYVAPIKVWSKSGYVNGTYQHENASGWYWIRLKANSNKGDEYADSTILYLEQGEMYYYSFYVNKLEEQEVVVSNYVFYGALSEKIGEVYLEEYNFSNGTSYKENIIEFITDVEDNQFNAVVMQLYDIETGEYIAPIGSWSSTGDVNTIYKHEYDSGWYWIRLKVNSNKQDEYIDGYTYLKQGEAYYYSFHIDKLEEQEAMISDYSFCGLLMTEEMDNIQFEEASEGCIEIDDGWILETELDENVFNSIVLSIYSEETDYSETTILSTSKLGINNKVFKMEGESGNYTIRVRVNSNKKDEYIKYMVYLEKGQEYCISVDILMLQFQKVLLGNMHIYNCSEE